MNLPCPPRNLVVRSPSLRSVCGTPDFSPASPSFFCHWQRSVLQPRNPSVAGHKKDTRFFLVSLFSIAETGFEPALPTSKSGRPLSLSAFCLRNSRFLACITFLLLPLAAVGAAAPGTRRSQGIKKIQDFFLYLSFRLRRQDLNLPCPPRNLVVRSPSLRSVCGTPISRLHHLPSSATGSGRCCSPGNPSVAGHKKDTRFFLVSLFSIAETGFEPATSGL